MGNLREGTGGLLKRGNIVNGTSSCSNEPTPTEMIEVEGRYDYISDKGEVKQHYIVVSIDPAQLTKLGYIKKEEAVEKKPCLWEYDERNRV